VPARTLVSSGVMTMAPRVDAVVMSTDSATSPCAMYVATLDACKEFWCQPAHPCRLHALAWDHISGSHEKLARSETSLI
jgi:hypothetical protein